MIENSFAELFDCAKKFYFWKGRVGLLALLRGSGVTVGDEVIIQGFTCVAVPNPIIYSGAKPIYVDIDHRTYTADMQMVNDAITNRTKAIVLQNSFGHAPDYDQVLSIAREKGICVIGDCAHGAGSKYKNIYDGFQADASIYSFQWTKPVTTGLGGCAVVNNHDAFPLLDGQINSLLVPTWKELSLLRAQRILHDLLMSPRSYWTLVSVYRKLRSMGLQVGSSSNEETVGNTEPANFFKGMSRGQQRSVIKSVQLLERKVQTRKQSACMYDSLCDKHGIRRAFVADYADHSFLRYPIEVGNNNISFEVAWNKRIQLGEWFLTPVDPGQKLSNWFYESGSCPRAERACKKIINLPTDSPLSEKQFLQVIN